MGFLNSLKSMSNFITGGGATVTVEATSNRLGEPLRVVVRAAVKDSAIKVNQVYLRVRSEEEMVFDDLPLAMEVEENGQRFVRVEKQNVQQRFETWSHEFQVAGSQNLPANSEHEWVYQVTLPADAMPSFNGQKIRHLWQLYAGLDTFGNDPDSGWVTVDLVY